MNLRSWPRPVRRCQGEGRASDWQIWTPAEGNGDAATLSGQGTIRAERPDGKAFGRSSLPLPQRLGRVDAHRAMRRQVDGDPADGREQGRHPRKRKWINRGDLEQQRLRSLPYNTATIEPMAMPATVRAALTKDKLWTWRGSAPTATRIPISLVRSTTD